jgi:transcriptional regulator with XRE-family HTH domain
VTAASKELRYTCATPFSTILSGLAEMILAERKARGLSVRAAAEECGIPYNCLSRAERNIGLPSTPVFMAIVAWLGVPGWEVCAAALSAAAIEADGAAENRWVEAAVA